MSSETKLMLAYLVQNYNMRSPEDKTRLKNVVGDIMIMPRTDLFIQDVALVGTWEREII